MSEDCVQRFLLDDIGVCGTLVRLGPAWREMLEARDYPPPVADLLGQIVAVNVLLGDKLKQPGRLTIQLRAGGPVSLLVVDCNQQLQIRGMARHRTPLESGSARQLLGDGQLLLSLEMASLREPYQSIVPLAGESIAEIFEHYLRHSDQLPARLFLAASATGAAGLLLQRLPTAESGESYESYESCESCDEDGWTRVEALAATVTAVELLSLDATELLPRLFHEETVRLFAPRQVAYHCPEDREKVVSMLRALGRNEVYAALQEQGEIVVRDDICNREYRFDALAIDAIFAVAPPPTLH